MDPNSVSASGVRTAGLRPAGSRRLFIDSAPDIAYAVRALAVGAATTTAFGNFYVIIFRPAVETVRRVNMIKGRPVAQVGSITTEASQIPSMFDPSLSDMEAWWMWQRGVPAGGARK